MTHIRYRCRIHNWIANKDVHHDGKRDWHYNWDGDECEVEKVITIQPERALQSPQPPQSGEAGHGV